MTTQPDYYGILQVHHKAEKEVVDAAYRQLAAKYHPDVSKAPDAMERMKQINAAYEVLSDPVRRVAYDAASGMVPPREASPHVVALTRYLSRAVWRSLMTSAGLIVLAMVAFKLGPRFVLLLVVFSVIVWLLFALARVRR